MASSSGGRLGAALLPLVLLAGSGLACRGSAPGPVTAPAWAVIVRGVEAPAGGAEPPAVKCRPGGAECAAMEPGAELTGDYELRTSSGARAFLDLGGGATLEMAGRTALAFTGGARPVVSLGHGAVAIDAPASPDAATPARWTLALAGRSLAIDPAMPASVAVRAPAEDRADVMVRRGHATLDDGGSRTDLRSGESAQLRPNDDVRRGLAASVPPELEERDREARPAEQTQPRGLGTMTARLPGTSEVVSGVRLSSHKISVAIHDGFARTEIEEEFANDSARVLEGRYVFPVPPDASISRLALWVGKDLVEGEIVERQKAATIFKSIADDSVRPRDPALLEWVSGSEVSLKIFPIPAHGSRKVVLAYDQVLSSPGGRARYVYPLSLGADRATKIDELALRVSVSDAEGGIADAATPGYATSLTPDHGGLTVAFDAKGFTPASDFVLTYEKTAPAAPADFVPAVLTRTEAIPGDGFVAIRLPVEWPAGKSPPPRARRDRAIVVDVSYSQSKEALAGEAAVAEGLLWHLDPDERFVVLACDSACAAFPDDGLSAVSEASVEEARTWLRSRAIGGSSDIAGAITAAARRLDAGGSGQIVYLGDGAASAGELSAATIAARVKPEIVARSIDLRIVGAGRTLDEVVLGGLARALGASYERLADGDPLDRRVKDLALALRAPLLQNAKLDVPAGLREVYPSTLPSLRVGQELVLVGKIAPGERGDVQLRGDLAGTAYASARPVSDALAEHTPSAVVPRLWAAARIAELEESRDADAVKTSVELSMRHHVMSRRTSLLVLENDRMFAEFGIERTQGKAKGAAPVDPGAGRSAEAARQSASFGMIGLLNGGAPAHASMLDESSARGNMWGSDVGESFGAGGLGLSGIGEGGGGRGEGIGLGDVGTMGHGAGDGNGQGFGSGHGRLGGSHRAQSSPQVRTGSATVSGRLPPEVIQRIVRQNFGRFRLCYESGLTRNPDLEGRVAVSFIIGRDGNVTNVTNGGSTLPDAMVVTCVVRSFFGLSFPQPEGGIVTVTYPITFSPGGGASSPAPQPSWSGLAESVGPSATSLAGDDAWMKQGEDALDKLRKAVEETTTSRQRHEALIRGLLARGRFAEALTAARRFADLDPDLGRARELLGAAAAAAGDAELARTALDAQVETSPESVDLHGRAARAFEASGDETRACAHWRSLADLRPAADELRYQALRCRARLGDREAAIGEATSIDKPGKMVAKLVAALHEGASPAYEMTAASPGEFEARVSCAEGVTSCPDLVVVKPSGDVISPWTPAPARSSAHSVAFSGLSDGTYRTLLVGGAPDARGEVEIRAFGAVKKLRIEHGGLQTIAATTITTPQGWGRW